MTEEIQPKTLTDLAREEVEAIFLKRGNNYSYHNLKHTMDVVEAVRGLSEDFNLDGNSAKLLEVAALFHDTAYSDGGKEGHESRSAELAAEFLSRNGHPQTDAEFVRKCILATQMDAVPESLPEMIIKDADYVHLSKKSFEKRADLLRMEWELVDGQEYSEADWLQKNVNFLEEHKFYTTIARNAWEERKQAHLSRLQKRLESVRLAEMEGRSLPPADKKRNSYSRGVETMFRVTLRNHIQLSKIADNKANFLLSISGIILSLLLGNLITDNNPVQSLIGPSIVFLVVCIVTMVISIMATRPIITKGEFSREALLKKEVNILFFGNFHNMPLDDFDWGMHELMENDELLYHSLTTDLYFLGKVLHKKYQYLRLAFSVFMFGLIGTALYYLAVLLFVF